VNRYLSIGPFRFNAKWSSARTGWKTTHADGRVTRKYVELSSTLTEAGFPAITLLVWRLVLRFGYSVVKGDRK
jgi:hypothetical protein